LKWNARGFQPSEDKARGNPWVLPKVAEVRGGGLAPRKTQLMVGKLSRSLICHGGRSAIEMQSVLKALVGYSLEKAGGAAPEVASTGGQAPGSQHARESPGR
jgi:hypothetical protein